METNKKISIIITVIGVIGCVLGLFSGNFLLAIFGLGLFYLAYLELNKPNLVTRTISFTVIFIFSMVFLFFLISFIKISLNS